MPTADPSPWLLLSLTPGLGPILTQRLVARCGSADAACAASLAVLRTVEGVGNVGSDRIFAGLREARVEAPRVARQAERSGLRVVDFDADEYPPLLRLIPDPPAVLYVRGGIEPRDLNGVGVVGSRKCSLYGREQAGRFGALLAGAGFTVVSGGARGIDTAAHDGALSSTVGRTVAVLGCGADRVYPPENGRLFDRIASGGCGAVVSEYPPGTPPVAENFPKRNRIISGMTRGTLVVEADIRSGALITARQANEDQGRTVFALPGRADSPTSNGTHKLIRDGAVLVTCLEEIVDDLGPLPDEVRVARGATEGDPDDADPAPETLFTPPPPRDAPRSRRPAAAPEPPTPPPDVTLTPDQRSILDALDADGTSVDDLIDRTGLSAHVVLSNLTTLSLKGLARRLDGQTYARKFKV